MHATVPGLHMINMCPCILMFLGSPVQNVTPRDRLSHNVSAQLVPIRCTADQYAFWRLPNRLQYNQGWGGEGGGGGQGDWRQGKGMGVTVLEATLLWRPLFC